MLNLSDKDRSRSKESNVCSRLKESNVCSRLKATNNHSVCSKKGSELFYGRN